MNHFIRIFFFFLSLFAVAYGIPKPSKTTSAAPSPTVSQCNTGPVQCCQTAESANSPSAETLLGLLGIILEDLNVLVGLSCNPIIGNSCNASPLCCENNNFNGLIAIGCVEINL